MAIPIYASYSFLARWVIDLKVGLSNLNGEVRPLESVEGNGFRLLLTKECTRPSADLITKCLTLRRCEWIDSKRTQTSTDTRPHTEIPFSTRHCGISAKKRPQGLILVLKWAAEGGQSCDDTVIQLVTYLS